MPNSIMPLPVMLEHDQQRQREQALEPIKTIVCRYGYMKQIAELPYDGQAKPGCGSKLVIRTSRGIELAEMLTTTCVNAGCGKSVSPYPLIPVCRSAIDQSCGERRSSTGPSAVVTKAAVTRWGPARTAIGSVRIVMPHESE